MHVYLYFNYTYMYNLSIIEQTVFIWRRFRFHPSIHEKYYYLNAVSF